MIKVWGYSTAKNDHDIDKNDHGCRGRNGLYLHMYYFGTMTFDLGTVILIFDKCTDLYFTMTKASKFPMMILNSIFSLLNKVSKYNLYFLKYEVKCSAFH